MAFGYNGSGKSTLLSLITGNPTPKLATRLHIISRRYTARNFITPVTRLPIPVSSPYYPSPFRNLDAVSGLLDVFPDVLA
ncbi:hypothetical protein GYMLUDRAFT_263084 [Collybiopsis luxurians FD-317 M1]|uniref:ABC transporter domain-containing protein n=1 Tax=Collybiopsis luxurians FD-317 M1 TaxID=944289 RepID=A0A0D0B323_9AGAR|nr:hypothetical protein GYMLUDRAFT_263084 [Collybiopsis luxurians FD-317 M1]